MSVLVTAASEHGATGEIAARLGNDLAELGIEVEVRTPEEVHELAHYDAFVIGSAIYMGHWLKAAKSFVDSHAAELAAHPSWLFSSGPVGDPLPSDPQDAAQGEALAATVHAREHKLFPGKLDKATLSWCEKVAVRCAHASEGDYRNWQAIDDWAAAIAHQLQQERVAGAAARSSEKGA